MSADLRNLIAAWHHHDRIGREAEKAGDPDQSDAASEKATEILGAIADAPILTADEIMEKLAFACEAFDVREERDESDEALGGFVRRSLIDARRIVATRRDAS